MSDEATFPLEAFKMRKNFASIKQVLLRQFDLLKSSAIKNKFDTPGLFWN
jgi:hypothetical protein